MIKIIIGNKTVINGNIPHYNNTNIDRNRNIETCVIVKHWLWGQKKFLLTGILFKSSEMLERVHKENCDK